MVVGTNYIGGSIFTVPENESIKKISEWNVIKCLSHRKPCKIQKNVTKLI
jgi:hypothetical protein